MLEFCEVTNMQMNENKEKQVSFSTELEKKLIQ